MPYRTGASPSPSDSTFRTRILLASALAAAAVPFAALAASAVMFVRLPSPAPSLSSLGWPSETLGASLVQAIVEPQGRTAWLVLEPSERASMLACHVELATG